jgi:exodeoxyribonuclease-3
VVPLSVKYDIGVPKHDREGRTITLEYEKFYLVAVYVPNSGVALKWLEYRVNEWDVDFRNYLKSLELKGKPVVLVGDLNVAPLDIDVYNPQGNDKNPCFTEEERCSYASFKSLGFNDTFREKYPGKIKFSFWDVRQNMRKENKGWRLDYALVSKNVLPWVSDSQIHCDIWGSDHWPISVTIEHELIDVDEFREEMNCDELESEKSEMNFSDDEILSPDNNLQCDFDPNSGSNEELSENWADNTIEENEANKENIQEYQTPPISDSQLT